MKFGIFTATLVTAGMAAPTPQLTGLSLAGDLSEPAGLDTQPRSPDATDGTLDPNKPEGGLLGSLVESIINGTPKKGSTPTPSQGKGTQRPKGTQTKGSNGGAYKVPVPKNSAASDGDGGMRRRRLGPEAEQMLEALMAVDPQGQEEEDFVRSAVQDLQSEAGDGFETTEGEEMKVYKTTASKEELGSEPKRRQLDQGTQAMVDALMAERPQEQHQTLEELLGGESGSTVAGQTGTHMRRRQLSLGAQEELEALLAEVSQGGQQTKHQLSLPTQAEIDAIMGAVGQGQQGQELETRQAEDLTDEEAFQTLMAAYEQEQQEQQEHNPKKRQVGDLEQLLSEFASGQGKGPAGGKGSGQTVPRPKPVGQGASLPKATGQGASLPKPANQGASLPKPANQGGASLPKPAGQEASLPKPASQGQSSGRGGIGKNPFATSSSKSGATNTAESVAVAEWQNDLNTILS